MHNFMMSNFKQKELTKKENIMLSTSYEKE